MRIPRSMGQPAARAQLSGSPAVPALAGTVLFYPAHGGTFITARVDGLPQEQRACAPGFFALHIHAGHSCADAGFPQTGSHYDPQDCPHPAHAGDLPPLLSCQGSAFLSVFTDRFRVQEVIGRTVVIHGGADDFHSQPAGNAGQKIGCGRIVPLRNARF